LKEACIEGLLNDFKKFENGMICNSRTVRTAPYRTYCTRQHCNGCTNITDEYCIIVLVDITDEYCIIGSVDITERVQI